VSNTIGSSINKSDRNDLSLLDSFFGGKQSANQNKIQSHILNYLNFTHQDNTNNNTNYNNKGSDIHYITRSFEEATRKSNDKPSSIFGGIDYKNKIISNNNSLINGNEKKIKLIKPKEQDKISDLIGFNFDFNSTGIKNTSNKNLSIKFYFLQ